MHITIYITVVCKQMLILKTKPIQWLFRYPVAIYRGLKNYPGLLEVLGFLDTALISLDSLHPFFSKLGFVIDSAESHDVAFLVLGGLSATVVFTLIVERVMNLCLKNREVK